MANNKISAKSFKDTLLSSTIMPSTSTYTMTFDQLHNDWRYQRDIYGNARRDPRPQGSPEVQDMTVRFNEQMIRFESMLVKPLKTELARMEEANENLMAQVEALQDEIADLQETLAEYQEEGQAADLDAHTIPA